MSIESGPTELPGGERLQKVLARAGFGSRRVCEDLIAQGRITVDGEVAQLGRRVEPERSRILVDGVVAIVDTALVYYLLNKPVQTVSTAHDPQGRVTVVDMVPSEPRVFPVGRLDLGTEGLLLLTNDGELANRLMHPSRGVEKEYLAEVEGTPSREALRMLREGVALDDGMTAPARAHIVTTAGQVTALEIVLHEGRNRQVRRMCEAIGHPVRRLVRTRIGPIADRRLEPGTWRSLTAAEVRSLYEISQGAASEAPFDARGERAGDEADGSSAPSE